MTQTLDRIRASLVGLRMPCALEALDHTMRQLERGEIGALEAIDALLAEEHATRETRRIGVSLKTARLTPPKTLESFDFTFQPSLDRGRIMALAAAALLSARSLASPASENFPLRPTPSTCRAALVDRLCKTRHPGELVCVEDVAEAPDEPVRSERPEVRFEIVHLPSACLVPEPGIDRHRHHVPAL